jgi:hypothetical protein
MWMPEICCSQPDASKWGKNTEVSKPEVKKVAVPRVWGAGQIVDPFENPGKVQRGGAGRKPEAQIKQVPTAVSASSHGRSTHWVVSVKPTHRIHITY